MIYENRIGLRYEIIKRLPNNRVIVRFCGSGSERNVHVSNAKTGGVKDMYHPQIFGVGFIGEAERKGNEKAHSVWYSMLRRCYCEKALSRNPKYKNVTVCESWFNFENFLPWFESNYIEGFELDKDLFGSGEYCPEACVFLDRKVNTFLTGTNYSGVTYRERSDAYIAQSSAVKSRHLGSYRTYKEAVDAVKRDRLDRIDKFLVDGLVSRTQHRRLVELFTSFV